MKGCRFLLMWCLLFIYLKDVHTVDWQTSKRYSRCRNPPCRAAYSANRPASPIIKSSTNGNRMSGVPSYRTIQRPPRSIDSRYRRSYRVQSRYRNVHPIANTGSRSAYQKKFQKIFAFAPEVYHRPKSVVKSPVDQSYRNRLQRIFGPSLPRLYPQTRARRPTYRYRPHPRPIYPTRLPHPFLQQSSHPILHRGPIMQ